MVDNLIHAVIAQWTKDRKIFTSYDIVREIQSMQIQHGVKPEEVAIHSDMKGEIHATMKSVENYDKAFLDIGFPKKVFVYCPVGADATQYKSPGPVSTSFSPVVADVLTMNNGIELDLPPLIEASVQVQGGPIELDLPPLNPGFEFDPLPAVKPEPVAAMDGPIEFDLPPVEDEPVFEPEENHGGPEEPANHGELEFAEVSVEEFPCGCLIDVDQCITCGKCVHHGCKCGKKVEQFPGDDGTPPSVGLIRTTDARGNLSIPAQMLREIGIEPGMEARVVLSPDMLMITREPPKKSLAGPTSHTILPNNQVKYTVDSSGNIRLTKKTLSVLKPQENRQFSVAVIENGIVVKKI